MVNLMVSFLIFSPSASSRYPFSGSTVTFRILLSASVILGRLPFLSFQPTNLEKLALLSWPVTVTVSPSSAYTVSPLSVPT